MERAYSIRGALLARLVGPLVLVTLLGGACAYGLAWYYSQSVLDHWLYDSAISLANRVKWENGRSTVDLPEGAREILEWDTVDHIYYEVISEHGKRLLGNAFIGLPPTVPAAGGPPVYYETRLGGAAVRVLVVAIAVPHENPVIVKVGETLHKRNALATQVLWISVCISLALAVICAAVIWFAIGNGVTSIGRAIRSVCAAHEAAPLSPIAIGNDVPREVYPLVEEINDLIDSLSRAHQLNQRFIADAAHQLRTPLASLRVQLEIALRETDPERHTRAVNDAVSVLTRMGRTVHQLLTLAKADDKDSEVNVPRSLVDIDLLARDEVERRLDDALAAEVDLGYSGSGRPVWVRMGVPDLLREALANLLDNALRYGAAGGQVTVGVIAEGPELFVEDAGPGISSAERERVCERFYRVRGSPADGCGLGLSIASEIVRRHGGTLTLEPAAAGSGLRARIVFPAAGIEAMQRAAA